MPDKERVEGGENKAALSGTENCWMEPSRDPLPQPPGRANLVSRAPEGLICSHPPVWMKVWDSGQPLPS